jgi:hypothetical protein
MMALRKEMIAVRHRAGAMLVSLLVMTASLLLPAPARAAVAGVRVEITELPDEFEAGAGARTVEVVASTDRAPDGRRCRKVRWALLMQADGPDPDQIRVDRIEEDGSFPVRVRTEDDTARVTDVRLDPGQLCPGRTVTARYRVAFDDDAATGAVTFQAQAFGADNRLLETAAGTSQVIGTEPSPSPSPSETESAADQDAAVAEAEPSEGAAAPPAGTGSPDLSAASASGGVPSLLGPGLIVGAVLVFAGIGLLLRIRLRNRGARHSRRQMATRFYPAP